MSSYKPQYRPSSSDTLESMMIRVSIHDKANPAPTHQLRQIYELLIIVCCHVPEGVGGIAFTVDVIEDESNFLEMC